MKNPLTILFLAAFVILQLSYSSLNAESAEATHPYKKQILFFSNETNYMTEAGYYDAILDLMTEYPEEAKNLVTLQAKNHPAEAEQFQLSETPAIVVLSETGNVISRISGSQAHKDAVKSTILSGIHKWDKGIAQEK